MSQPIKYLILTLPSTIIAIVVCYYFIDKPLAHEMLILHPIKRSGAFSLNASVLLTQLSYLVIVLMFIVLFFCHARAKTGRLVNCLTLLCTSMAISFFIKSVLQFTFGRYVPRYRASDILLFERNHHLYGFHWFQSGCFPSGHMAVFSAALCAIALYYPRGKLISICLGLILAIALIALNYHFLSDIIAGTYLGMTITLAVYYLEATRHTNFMTT